MIAGIDHHFHLTFILIMRLTVIDKAEEPLHGVLVNTEPLIISLTWCSTAFLKLVNKFSIALKVSRNGDNPILSLISPKCFLKHMVYMHSMRDFFLEDQMVLHGCLFDQLGVDGIKFGISGVYNIGIHSFKKHLVRCLLLFRILKLPFFIGLLLLREAEELVHC